MLAYDRIVQKLFDLFPQVYEHTDSNYIDLPYVVFEDVFVPYIKKRIINESPDIGYIFFFLEKMANSDDPEVRNLLKVCVLESLATDDSVRAASKRYMEKSTYALYQTLSEYLNSI